MGGRWTAVLAAILILAVLYIPLHVTRYTALIGNG
jgi:hypothetical protein